MALIAEFRKNVTESTPLLAVVGATDYAVERVRQVAANPATLQEEMGKTLAALETVPAAVQARVKKLDSKTVQQVPALAMARALETAGKVEASYEEFAARGKELLERVGQRKPTQGLINQGKVTVTRTKAVVTTARKTMDDTTTAARQVVARGRREADQAVAQVAESVAATERVVAARVKRAPSTPAAAPKTEAKAAPKTETKSEAKTEAMAEVAPTTAAPVTPARTVRKPAPRTRKSPAAPKASAKSATKAPGKASPKSPTTATPSSAEGTD